MKEKIQYLITKLNNDNLTEEDIREINILMFNFHDEITSPDLILVLASSSIKRIEKAVELSKKYHLKILISGANYLKKDRMYEYEKYYIYAITHGLTKDDLILESISHNTKENIINSLKIIKDKYHNIIIISSSQHLLRVKLTLEKELVKNNITDLNYYLVPSYATLVPKDTWYKEKKAKEIIKGELERLIKYRLIKYRLIK